MRLGTEVGVFHVGWGKVKHPSSTRRSDSEEVIGKKWKAKTWYAKKWQGSPYSSVPYAVENAQAMVSTMKAAASCANEICVEK